MVIDGDQRPAVQNSMGQQPGQARFAGQVEQRAMPAEHDPGVYVGVVQVLQRDTGTERVSDSRPFL